MLKLTRTIRVGFLPLNLDGLSASGGVLASSQRICAKHRGDKRGCY